MKKRESTRTPDSPHSMFPSLANPLLMSPLFKPLTASVANPIRPLNLSLRNSLSDSVRPASPLAGAESMGKNGNNSSTSTSSSNGSSSHSKRHSPGLVCVVCGDCSR